MISPAGTDEPILRSSLLSFMGVTHGFTTRQGGVSSGPFESLNLHEKLGDDPECVRKNQVFLAKRASFPLSSLCQVVQVHGNRAVWLSQPEKNQQEADAMVTNVPLTLSVKYADCVPILLADGQGTVAAIHAGWRGTVKNVVREAIVLLQERGVSVQDIRVAIGPSIGPCCFEVDADVAAQFTEISTDCVLQHSSSRYRVDLWKANRILLEREGVLSPNIDVNPPCTACHPALFFSHRRDGVPSGRHLAFITGGPNNGPSSLIF